MKNIEKTVVLNKEIHTVWEVVSTAKGIAQWLMPNNFVAEVGAEFTIQLPFGPSACKVTNIKKPTYIRFDWDVDGWFIEFKLQGKGEKTEFTLIHGGWKVEDFVSSAAKMPTKMVHTNMAGGWEKIVGEKLVQVVEQQ
ncbi:SRPBCC family protein [Kurthia zopfii]|uniref:SRPBCC family protein n=1 Tax=Kurthia zopfii TaxID=1650 RepID=UPI000F6F7F89|nr:SRPBCC domain-containing protein [Kurthia zopfii]VEI07306.1 Activator of Hsp90 ATPase homolog 1-like protein [Kurthia zopfii]